MLCLIRGWCVGFTQSFAGFQIQARYTLTQIHTRLALIPSNWSGVCRQYAVRLYCWPGTARDVCGAHSIVTRNCNTFLVRSTSLCSGITLIPRLSIVSLPINWQGPSSCLYIPREFRSGLTSSHYPSIIGSQTLAFAATIPDSQWLLHTLKARYSLRGLRCILTTMTNGMPPTPSTSIPMCSSSTLRTDIIVVTRRRSTRTHERLMFERRRINTRLSLVITTDYLSVSALTTT